MKSNDLLIRMQTAKSTNYSAHKVTERRHDAYVSPGYDAYIAPGYDA